jgi:F-type H+-transporting ATPase subunit b
MNLLDFYIPEDILVALSLLILVVLLRRFLWKPIMKVVDGRRQRVDDMLRSADDAKKLVAEMEAERASHSADLERQRVEMTKDARERASREYDRIVGEAEKKASEIIEAGEEKARRAYEQIMSEAQEAIVSLALGAASAVVESRMDSDGNRAFVEAMLQKAGGAQ